MIRSHRHRRPRLRTGVAGLGLLLLVTSLASTSTTLASWTNPEYGSATFTAGILQPPTGLTCSGGLASVTFSWVNATTGAARTGLSYTWAGGAAQTLGASATTTTVLSLINVGSVFTLRSTNGSWRSSAVTATVTSVVIGAVSCTVGTAP